MKKRWLSLLGATLAVTTLALSGCGQGEDKKEAADGKQELSISA